MRGRVGDETGTARRRRLRHRLAAEVVLVLVVAAVSIAVALLVTPMQQVSAAGQTVEVGVTSPSVSWSGPAELDLFGQTIPTTTTFAGPVRPRLRLTHITLSEQLAEIKSTTSGNRGGAGLQDVLVSGFRRFFYWQVAITGAVAVLLLGAVCGWRRRTWPKTLATIVVGLLVAEGINVGAIMATAHSAPAKLAEVHSLEQLVGASPIPVPDVPDAAGSTGSAAPAAGEVVVLGDSTAAGLGNPVAQDATTTDRACQRSEDSYPRALGQLPGLDVTSLACSGATIAEGVLGPQVAGGVTVPPQITDPAVAQAATVIVSIGANDVRWTDILRICAVSRNCDNGAEQAYFQSHLASFSSDWLQLVTALRQLPHHPRVIVNLYYDPFAGDVSCLADGRVTSAKLRSMLSRLAILNSVLSQGADTAGFATALPDFSGHGLCDTTPYVQGLSASAPFHPTPEGGLAIALADAPVLSDLDPPDGADTD